SCQRGNRAVNGSLIVGIWVLCALGAWYISEQRHLGQGAGWFLLGFFFALFFALIAKPTRGARALGAPDARVCPRCGRERTDQNRFCGQCAFEFAASG